MKVTWLREGATTVCRLVGDLDSYSVASVRQQIADVRMPGQVAIDLSGVPFVDSAGLGAIIGSIRRIRDAGGRVAVCGPRPPVARLLHVAGLGRIIPVLPTVADALAELRCETVT